MSPSAPYGGRMTKRKPPPTRHVEVHVLAAAGDRTIVLCHAAPGAGNLDPDPARTAERAVTLPAVDRPGYGGSDRVRSGEWATVASAADDIASVLDERDSG